MFEELAVSELKARPDLGDVLGFLGVDVGQRLGPRRGHYGAKTQP
jgi:hypothetical protein